MKQIRLLALIALVGGAFCEHGSVFSCSIASATPSPSNVEFLDTFVSRVREYKLSNGLTVLMYKRGAAPVFSGAVTVRVGGSDEVLGETGISHMFEHMAFKGTSRIGTTDWSLEKDLLAELETIAAESDGGNAMTPAQRSRWDAIHSKLRTVWDGEQFSRDYSIRGGVGLNATTDSEITQYVVNLPRNQFEFWCQREAERLIDPVLRQFYQERDVVMEERRMRVDDSPEGRIFGLVLGTAFLVHPYKNPVIGYAQDIRRLTATKLDAFRKRYYVPSNMVISLVGDIDHERDIEIVRRYFEPIPEGPNPPRPTIVEPPQEGERTVTIEADAQPSLSVAYRKESFPHADDPAVSVLGEILAGSRVSPLYTDLVLKSRIATGVDQGDLPGFAYPNLLFFAISTRAPHSNAEALAAFDSVVEEVKTKGVSDDAVAIAKRNLKVSYLSQLNSNQSIATDLGTTQMTYGDWKVIRDWLRDVMTVSPDDVQRVAQKYLQRSSRVVGKIERKKGNSTGSETR